jgi:hypothetical protein
MSLLRRQFTETLLNTLKKQSVNVHGDYGQGQTRLLEDLEQLARAQGFIVLSVDMKRWTEQYDGMINELSRQLRAQLPAVTEPIGDLAQLVTALDTHAANITVLLMLQQFDALLDNAVHLDSKYAPFFPHLNSLRNQAKRVLLVITAKPYNQYRVYIDQIHNTSPLDLRLWQLNKLSYHEIKDELQPRVTQLTGQQLNLLTRSVHEHPQAFEFLEYCVDQLNLGNEQDLNLPKRLKLWHKGFNRVHKKIVRKRLDGLLNWLAIVGKEIDGLSLKLKLVVASLLGLIGVFTDVFDKVKQPVMGLWQMIGWGK